MRDKRERERSRGQDQIPGLDAVCRVADAPGRQPVEIAREYEDEHDAPEKLRHRNAEIGEDGNGVVGQAVLADRRNDAKGDAQDRDAGKREDCKNGRAAQRLTDHRPDRSLHDQRLAEITGQHARRPPPVLNMDRIVEAELGFDRGDHIGGRELAGDHVRDVPRHHLGDAEDQQRHHHEDEGDGEQALSNVCNHITRLRRPKGAASRAKTGAIGPSSAASRATSWGSIGRL